MIRSIPSSTDSEGVLLVGVVNHPNWLTFARKPDTTKECPRVAIFINIRLALFRFSFCKDIMNHRDILLALFFINSELFWIMNVYSDSSHSAIKYLKDTEINICNLLVMTGDFNICDSLWDPLFLHHSSISDDLIIIADSFNLNLLMPINCHIQVHLSGNNVPTVKQPLNHTSLPSMVATLLATCLMAVLQPSGYSVFHDGDTPIQLGLPWWS